MTIAKAKEYYSLGLVHSVVVHAPDLLNSGWTVELCGNIGSAGPLLKTSRGDVRAFKTLDAAAKVVREIGLRTWSVTTL